MLQITFTGQRLKRASQEGRLSEQDIAAIMQEKRRRPEIQESALPAKRNRAILSESYTPEQKRKIIVKLQLGAPAWRLVR